MPSAFINERSRCADAAICVSLDCDGQADPQLQLTLGHLRRYVDSYFDYPSQSPDPRKPRSEAPTKHLASPADLSPLVPSSLLQDLSPIVLGVLEEGITPGLDMGKKPPSREEAVAAVALTQDLPNSFVISSPLHAPRSSKRRPPSPPMPPSPLSHLSSRSSGSKRGATTTRPPPTARSRV